MIPGGGEKDDVEEFRHWAKGASPLSTVASSSLANSHHLFSPFPILNPPGNIPATEKEIDEAGSAGGEGPPAVGGRIGGSIAERRAARSGFNAARLNDGRFPAMSPLPSPTSRSPYLMIPPGLSPTTLLDSPVMLLNSLQAQLSPTTGTFPNLSTMDHNPVSVLDSDATKENKAEDANNPSFAFNPHLGSDNSHTNGLVNKVSSASNEIVQHGGLVLDMLGQTEMQIAFADDNHHGKLAKEECITDSVAHMETSVNGLDRLSFVDLQSHFSVGLEDPSHSDGQLHVDDLGSLLLLEGNTKELCPLAGVGKPSEDGYNWRKYGQKQVKGSEYPRSYYKCTHPNCQVKKKVERSHDGQITEIIYKGTHSHSKPQPCRRSAIGSAFALNEMTERPDSTESFVKVESGPICRNAQQQGLKDKSTMDWRNDILDRTSSVSAVTDISDPFTPLQGKRLNHLESADSQPELSYTLASDNEFADDEDGVSQISISLGDDGDGDDDESKSKRRKMDYSPTEANFSSRSVREPRVVLQTASEVDILDDGYRWRKYGQKVVKGNPNPRSYYKCTNPGCSVRKHVERASHDLKSVITTYEGKHNHEVPAARSSSHGNSVSVNMGSSSVAAQSSMTLPTASGITKPEPRMDDFVPNFKVNGYLNPASYLRNLTADMKLGVSPCYNMKFPALQLMPFTSFGMHIGHSETNSLVSLSQTASNVPGPIPLSMQVPANLLVTANLGFNPAKGVGVMQPYLAQQNIKEGDARLLRPKERAEGSVSG